MAICIRNDRKSFPDSSARSFPSTSTVPVVGLSRKFRQRTKVLLPAPLMPIIPYISPLWISKLISFRASTVFSLPINVLPTFFTCMIVSICTPFLSRRTVALSPPPCGYCSQLLALQATGESVPAI